MQVAQATKGDMPVILNELGTVTPLATVTVMPNQAVSGYLTDVSFKEGQDVVSERAEPIFLPPRGPGQADDRQLRRAKTPGRPGGRSWVRQSGIGGRGERMEAADG